MLYKAKNKSNNQMWIVADNEQEAIEIAIKRSFVKKRENCQLSNCDKKGKSYYDFFKEKGNDMKALDTKKGIGAVAYRNTNDKGTWIVY